MERHLRARRAYLIAHLVTAVATILIAGCASFPWANGLKDTQKAGFTGRISLQVDSTPPQSFSGGFDLQGSTSQGELTLFTPLGSTAAVMRWSPGRAELQNGASTQAYPSVQAMMERTTGAAVPIEALFAWLSGDAANVPGWQADVSRHADGRISALRTDPAPPAQLRIVIDR
jgi:outer membrane lipoprotein LolB